jgi:hypothetical protein
MSYMKLVMSYINKLWGICRHITGIFNIVFLLCVVNIFNKQEEDKSYNSYKLHSSKPGMLSSSIKWAEYIE